MSNKPAPRSATPPQRSSRRRRPRLTQPPTGGEQPTGENRSLMPRNLPQPAQGTRSSNCASGTTTSRPGSRHRSSAGTSVPRELMEQARTLVAQVNHAASEPVFGSGRRHPRNEPVKSGPSSRAVHGAGRRAGPERLAEPSQRMFHAPQSLILRPKRHAGKDWAKSCPYPTQNSPRKPNHNPLRTDVTDTPSRNPTRYSQPEPVSELKSETEPCDPTRSLHQNRTLCPRQSLTLSLNLRLNWPSRN